MNISSRCEYACRAIVELALHEKSHDTVTSQTVAERRHIPEKYLVHILLQLKRAGLVRSVRGAQGGYALGKAPEDITLLDIVEAIDGPLLDPLPVNDGASQELKAIWRNVAKNMAKVLRQTTIRQILDKAAGANMYYI
jgi:Rrf2 family protein